MAEQRFIVKEFIMSRAAGEAARYNMTVDVFNIVGKACTSNPMNLKDTFAEIWGTIISETEKAIRVKLKTGWTMWIPKSQMMDGAKYDEIVSAMQ